MPPAHYVYILRCAGQRLYTGYATDVQARFALHCAGKGARFTRAFPPEATVRVFTCIDKSSALRLEACIKTLRKPHKEALVSQAPASFC